MLCTDLGFFECPGSGKSLEGWIKHVTQVHRVTWRAAGSMAKHLSVLHYKALTAIFQMLSDRCWLCCSPGFIRTFGLILKPMNAQKDYFLKYLYFSQIKHHVLYLKLPTPGKNTRKVPHRVLGRVAKGKESHTEVVRQLHQLRVTANQKTHWFVYWNTQHSKRISNPKISLWGLSHNSRGHCPVLIWGLSQSN